MEYNNKLEPLILPEYGRNVQQMVEHCFSISDRKERQICAETIVKTMKKMSPDKGRDGSDMLAYWEHLSIISGFKLDVDYPEGILTQEKIKGKVPKPSYQKNDIYYKCYGNNIERMIETVVSMPEGEERSQAEYEIALNMKKFYLAWNKDFVEDVKIFKDLYELSKGKIMIAPDSYVLNINTNNATKKSNKKNNVKKK